MAACGSWRSTTVERQQQDPALMTGNSSRLFHVSIIIEAPYLTSLAAAAAAGFRAGQ